MEIYLHTVDIFQFIRQVYTDYNITNLQVVDILLFIKLLCS